MRTRSMTRSTRKLYRSRVKKSHCRGQSVCRKSRHCKMTKSGKRKSYCRKDHNIVRKLR